MVGGRRYPAFARKIGADGYTSSAIEAVEFAKEPGLSMGGKKAMGKEAVKAILDGTGADRVPIIMMHSPACDAYVYIQCRRL